MILPHHTFVDCLPQQSKGVWRLKRHQGMLRTKPKPAPLTSAPRLNMFTPTFAKPQATSPTKCPQEDSIIHYQKIYFCGSCCHGCCYLSHTKQECKKEIIASQHLTVAPWQGRAEWTLPVSILWKVAIKEQSDFFKEGLHKYVDWPRVTKRATELKSYKQSGTETYQEGYNTPLRVLPLEAAFNILQRIENGRADLPHSIDVTC